MLTSFNSSRPLFFACLDTFLHSPRYISPLRFETLGGHRSETLGNRYYEHSAAVVPKRSATVRLKLRIESQVGRPELRHFYTVRVSGRET